jgi:hypothetical protein
LYNFKQNKVISFPANNNKAISITGLMIVLLATALTMALSIGGLGHQAHADDNAVDACNAIEDTDKSCEQKLEGNTHSHGAIVNNKDNQSEKGRFAVTYDDTGLIYGQSKLIIKNEDTGRVLVESNLNFTKQRDHDPNCCVKVYIFNDKDTHDGDDISAKVISRDGSWESGPLKYTKNLTISIHTRSNSK